MVTWPDVFSNVSLSDAFSRLPAAPGIIGALGAFVPRSIATTNVQIERRQGELRLIPTSPRGAPYPVSTRPLRDASILTLPRIAVMRPVSAAMIQDARALGSAELATLQETVAQQMLDLRLDLEATLEAHRLGSLSGAVLDADGSTVINWHDEWGSAEPSAVSFALGTATTDVLGKCAEVVRAIVREVGSGWNADARIVGLSGHAFFDALRNHDRVRGAFAGSPQASRLAEGRAFQSFSFGGIDFIDYQAGAAAGVGTIATDDCRFFPVGVPGLLQAVSGPGETFDDVNALGQPMILRMTQPDQFNKTAYLIAASYTLHAVARPQVLRRGTRA